MLSDRDALLAAICAHPDEDTPRLMFADWLDENGEPDRAEFVRLQCELAALADDGGEDQPVYEFLRDRDDETLRAADWARIAPGVHRRLALTARANDLLARHRDEWAPKLPKKYKIEWAAFHRGFPHRVTLGDPRKLKPVAARLRAATPAVTLVAHRLTVAYVEALAEVGLLGWVSGLELIGECGPTLRAFGAAPEAAGVRTVVVQGYGDTGDVAKALAESPNWSGLRVLDLSHLLLGPESVEALAGAKHLRALRRLRLHGSGNWTTDTVRALAGAGFSELTALDLEQGGLDDNAAKVLAGCPHFAGLRALHLAHNNITGRGITALLRSRHLVNVAYLGLGYNPCGGLDAKRLATVRPGGLRLLHCHGAAFRPVTADVRALARCPRLRTLWYLDLDAAGIGTPAVRELVRGFKDFCPPVLWMISNRIDDRGAEVLANWPATTGLSVLQLRYNSALTARGIQSLLDSPNLAGLDNLSVHTSDDKLTARLRARFRRGS